MTTQRKPPKGFEPTGQGQLFYHTLQESGGHHHQHTTALPVKDPLTLIDRSTITRVAAEEAKRLVTERLDMLMPELIAVATVHMERLLSGLVDDLRLQVNTLSDQIDDLWQALGED